MTRFGIAPDVVTYNILADSYNVILKGMFQLGECSAAKELVRLDPDVVTYTRMITALCKEGLLEEANEVFIQMEANGCLANEITYNAIIRVLIKGDKYDDAAVYLQEMRSKGFVLNLSNSSDVLNIISRKKKCSSS
ncbi:OLC1v1004640C1 [Oldenlandia corymbosa var. corymbosa]|uniref:OLC1v1004640C1 n=1 Tax=Oldenlandia corymbosa var. corymbosa TaxID=529605 RepID=A0AAV1DFR8_OLDCO|nr:OLC1v1004640C1 [Oldenlandia corymbosa var. corymbosa]